MGVAACFCNVLNLAYKLSPSTWSSKGAPYIARGDPGVFVAGGSAANLKGNPPEPQVGSTESSAPTELESSAPGGDNMSYVPDNQLGLWDSQGQRHDTKKPVEPKKSPPSPPVKSEVGTEQPEQPARSEPPRSHPTPQPEKGRKPQPAAPVAGEGTPNNYWKTFDCSLILGRKYH